MTSVQSSSSTNPNATTSTSSGNARTSSVSGQTASSAAVPASDSAPRQAALSYAHAVTSKKLPTGPGALSSSNPVSQNSGSATAHHGRSTSVPVNGKIQPAVPQIGNSNAPIANGPSSTHYSVGNHSRKQSLASGPMPNGASRGAPNIKFGAINEPGTAGPQTLANAVVAGNNLTAPVVNSPRANSPSPSTAAQPAASGGAPPSAGTARPIQFGDTTPHQRPVSLPPQPHHPPQGPNSMTHSQGHGHSHARRESVHDAGPHVRNIPLAGRGRGGGHHQGYPQGQYQNQSYGYSRGFSQGHNQPRNTPSNMGGPTPFPPQYPNSPRHVPRSPALTHASTHGSPSMNTVVPTTPQLYPPPHNQPFLPGSPHYVQQMYQDPSYYPQYQIGYQYQSTSPRAQYSHVAPSMGSGGYVPPYPPQAVSMSRSSSANVSDVHARPPSSIGQHPTSTMTSQSQVMVSPPQSGTPGPPPSPYGNRPPKRPVTKAIEIKNPTTGATVKIDSKTLSSPVIGSSSSPLIVSSPGPAPGRASSRPESPHSRSTSRSNKTNEEKRAEMREKVMLGAKKSEEEKRRKEEAAKAEALRKIQEQDSLRKKHEEEEKSRLEAETQRQRQDAEAKAIAEAEAEAEAEAKAEAEAEAKAKAEAEAKAKAEAEAAAVHHNKLELARAKAQEKLKNDAEENSRTKEQAIKEAETEAEAEAEAEALPQPNISNVLEVKCDEKLPASTPIDTPVSPAHPFANKESMPPPQSHKTVEKTRIIPSPINTHQNTEPGPLSAALTALCSARPVDNLRQVQYPEGIQSPNPALNPLANATKFKYDKEFLMQFQGVFTDKPSLDWDQRMRETVGDTESSRPTTARSLSSTVPRSNSSRGSSNISAGCGPMGSYAAAFTKPSVGTAVERFPKPSAPLNPFATMGTISRPGAGLSRANSSTSLTGSSANASQQNSRPGNRSARGSKKGTQGASMERSDSRQGSTQPSITITDVKPLPVSANRWQPRSVKPASVDTTPIASAEDHRLSPDMVQRKVKAALNKMTPEKFDKISDQILEITAQSKHESDGRTLRQVIQLTFEKATDEAHWASMYAKFCKRMLETMDPNIKDENIRDRNGAIVTGGNLFRKYLLNRCQEEFERGWKINLPVKPEGVTDEATMLSDEYYIAAAAKRRGLGLVQFIGELFKLGMLTERIMNKCVQKLLDFEGLPEDETVESLTKLLRTIGAQLDSSEKSKPIMDVYFSRIRAMVDNKELNSRMRFMLMDIIDLRKIQWESKDTNKGPKTIQEVREEAIKAQQEKEAVSRANRGNRPQGGRGDTRSFSSGGYGMNPSGVYHDNKDGGTIPQDELRKLGVRSRQVSCGTTSSFGPGTPLGHGPHGSGSRRGVPGSNTFRSEDSASTSRTATPPVPLSTSSTNKFSALSEASSHHDSNDTISPPPSTANSPQVSNVKPITDEVK